MAQGRLDEAAAAMEGRVIGGDPGTRWCGATLDSRAVAGGELFFALPGEHTDGHRFVGDALERGAAAAVVHRGVEPPSDGALIRVPDTLQALHALTRAVRRRLPARLAAITGSAGKTTTKEMLAVMLARRYRVAKSPGNLNNLYGFPLALLGVAEDRQWMVAEMGMSTPGELARLARMSRPDVVVYTNIRPVHLEFFGSLSAIAEAKAELLEGVDEDGLVVANADDPEVVRIVGRHRGRVVTYGQDRSAAVRARAIEPVATPGAGYRFELVVEGRGAAVTLPLHGLFNVDNFLAAAAASHALGVAVEEIAAAAASLRPASMRGELHPLPGGGRLIDDSYNSNPDALARALDSAARVPGRRRWAVLGEMRELGPEAPAFHRRAGEQAAAAGFDPVFGVGELARELVDAASAEGVDARWYADAETAAAAASQEAAPGDVLLVKGSRGVGLEAVVRAVLAGLAGGEGG